MREKLKIYSKLQEELNKIHDEIIFELKFKDDLKIEVIDEYWWIIGEDIYWNKESYKTDEFDSEYMFETYETEEYFITRIDYQQLVEDEYYFFDKNKQIK